MNIKLLVFGLSMVSFALLVTPFAYPNNLPMCAIGGAFVAIALTQ